MIFIETLVEGNISVKALIDITSKSNTISKSLFDKLKEDYELECLSGNELIGKEIKGLDLQFRYKAKISFKFSPGTYEQYGIITDPKNHCFVIIDGMSIPLIEEGSSLTGDSLSHKTSSTKNNLSKLTESKPGLTQEEVVNIINKILSGAQNIKHQKSHRRIFHNIPPAPPTSRRLNDNVLKNSRASKNKKYSKVDLDDGCGKLSLKMYLNNIRKSVYSIENNIEYGVFDKLRIIKYELSCINKSKLSWVKSDSSDTSDSSDSSSSRLRSEVIDTYMTTPIKKRPTKRKICK
ncbi:227_t:CDS:2, partial [Diversispora eburnea]